MSKTSDRKWTIAFIAWCILVGIGATMQGFHLWNFVLAVGDAVRWSYRLLPLGMSILAVTAFASAIWRKDYWILIVGLVIWLSVNILFGLSFHFSVLHFFWSLFSRWHDFVSIIITWLLGRQLTAAEPPRHIEDVL